MPPNKKKCSKKKKKTVTRNSAARTGTSTTRSHAEKIDTTGEQIALLLSDLAISSPPAPTKTATAAVAPKAQHGLDGDCPICLEPLAPFWEEDERSLLICCGQWTCRKCCLATMAAVDKSREDARAFQLDDKCILCKQNIGSSDPAERIGIILPHVAMGRAWAEASLVSYLVKTHTDNDALLEKGLWLLKASAMQGYPLAQHTLGQYYHKELESETDAMPWYAMAAEQGHASAQYELGFLHIGKTPGHEDFPLGVQLLRRAAASDHEEARILMEKVDDISSGLGCWNCEGTWDENSGRKMKHCTSCHVAQYCGRQCQREGWRSGHRAACKKQEEVMKKIEQNSQEREGRGE